MKYFYKGIYFEHLNDDYEALKYYKKALEYYISKGWSREKAESFVIQRHLSPSGERKDLKQIYLYS